MAAGTGGRSSAWVAWRVVGESVVLGWLLASLAFWGLFAGEQIEAEQRLGAAPLSGGEFFGLALYGLIVGLAAGVVLGILLALVSLAAVLGVSRLPARGTLRSLLLVLVPSMAVGSLPALTLTLVTAGRSGALPDPDQTTQATLYGLLFFVPAVVRGSAIQKAFRAASTGRTAG